MIDDILYKDIIDLMEVNRSVVEYECIGTEVLLLALVSIEDSMTNLILKEMKVTKETIADKIKESFFIRPQTKYTQTLENVIKEAKLLESEQEYVYDEAYLFSLLNNKDNVALEILKSLQIEGKIILDELSNALDYLQQESNLLINMTRLVKEKKTNPFIGREDYIEKIDRILSKKQKNNCMLIGLAGVGKSGLVEGVAQTYLKNKPDVTIYQLDLGALIAGTRYRGDLEERLMDTLDELKEINCILFIDEIHNILAGSSSENTLDIANLLKPYLARSMIKCIGATTVEEYYKTIHKDKALARRFQNIYINEPKADECFRILKGIKKDYEAFHNVIYTDEILHFIIHASKYNLHNNFPDKAIDILDESGLLTARKKKTYVTQDIIKGLIFENLGISYNDVLKKTQKTKNNIQNDIINYLNLVNDKYITSYEIETNDEKNQIIKDLVHIFNFTEDIILEIDLNDYPSDHHLASLLGTSPGYIGYDDGGILSNHVIKHNIIVVIFKNYLAGNIVLDRIITKIKSTGKIKDFKGNELNFLNCFLFFMKEDKKSIGFESN